MVKTKISISITVKALEYLKEVSKLEDRSISWLITDLIHDDIRPTEDIKRKGVGRGEGQ